MHMPAMNGLDFLLEKHRRNLAPGVPLVIITAGDSELQPLQAASSGAFGCITKPFTLKQFQTCVESLRIAGPASSGGPRSAPPPIP